MTKKFTDRVCDLQHWFSIDIIWQKALISTKFHAWAVATNISNRLAHPHTSDSFPSHYKLQMPTFLFSFLLSASVKFSNFIFAILIHVCKSFCAGESLANSTQDQVIWEEGIPTDESPSSNYSEEKANLCAIALVKNWCRWTYHGLCHPWKGSHELYKKDSWASQGEQHSRQCSSRTSALFPDSSFLLEFLPWLLFMILVIGTIINHFICSLVWIMVLYHSKSKSNQLGPNLIPGSWGIAVRDLTLLFKQRLRRCLVLWARKAQNVIDRNSDFYSIDFCTDIEISTGIEKVKNSWELKA